MARTPLLNTLEEVVAEVAAGEPRTTRRTFLRDAAAASAAATAVGTLAGRARAAAPPGRVVVVGAGLAGLTARTSAEAGWSGRGAARGVHADRRPLLDTPRLLRRRSDRGARRGADRPGPQPDPPPGERARAEPRQPPPGGDERHRADELVRRRSLLLRPRDRRRQSGVAEDPLGRLGRGVPDALRQLHRTRAAARPDVDRRVDRRDVRGRDRFEDRPAARRRLQHRVRRRVVRAELAQPALPARLRGSGQPAALRQVEREVPRARRERPDPGAARRAARGPDHDGVAAGGDPADGVGTLGADVQARVGDEGRHRGPRRARAPVLDHAGVGRLFAGRLRAVEGDGHPRAGNGNELEAARPVQEPALARARVQRRELLRPRLPGHVGGVARSGRRVRDPRRLHGRQHRRELRQRHAGVASEPVPRPGRAGAARGHERLQRQGVRRLLARLRVDARLLLVLQGRPVHEVRRDGGTPAGNVSLRRRAHLDRLPGLPERRGRDRRTRRRARS